MRVIIGNTVKTDFGDYPCDSREQAEALLMSLHLLERQRTQQREEQTAEERADAVSRQKQAARKH
jgi:hypothetical protein